LFVQLQVKDGPQSAFITACVHASVSFAAVIVKCC